MRNKEKAVEVPEGKGIGTNLSDVRLNAEEEIPACASEAVQKALQSVWKKVNSDSSKPSVTDLIRLLQLRNELKEDSPKNVIARWVDEWNTQQDE